MILKRLPGRNNEYLFTRDKSSLIWLSRFKKGFGRKQFSLETEVPAEARTKRDEFFAKWLGEVPKLSTKVSLTIDDIWPNFVLTKKHKSHATQDSINYSSKHLLPMCRAMDPNDVTEAWWLNTYVPVKRAQLGSDRKFFNDYKWLSSFLAFMHREGHIKRLPKLENVDPPRDAGLNLNDSEIAALYEKAAPDLKLQIDLGFKHFMRRSEVLLLPWSEIDENSRSIKLPAHRTKIRKAREIPLSDEVFEKLMSRRKEIASDWVFPSPRRRDRSIGRLGNATAWNAAIGRANKEKLQINPAATFHDLRHSGLSRAFTRTNKYMEICVVAGLSIKEAQKTYLHLKTDQTRFVTSLVSIEMDNNAA